MVLKIALYYPYIHLRSGVERTILEILKRSRHNWFVFTNLYEENSTYPDFKNFKDKIVELKKVSVVRNYVNTLKSAWVIFRQKLSLEGFDILWVHNEGLGSLINFKNKSIPSICFCHTPLKIIYDESLKKEYISKKFYKFPLYFIFSFLFKIIDKKAFGYYKWCFCVSEETKRRVIKNHLFLEQKLEVVYHGVDTKFFSGDVYYLNYFFHPTRIKWWKNIELSIKAFNIFQNINKEFSYFKLIIAGELYPTNLAYFHKLKRLASLNKNIIFIINPLENQLWNLYRNCRAVLSTTLNEDFGLTILEGFSFSKPAIAINLGGPKEIIKDKQTGFLSSLDAEEYASYLHMLAEDKDLAIRMGENARKEVLKYDWRNFISYIDNFLEDFILKFRSQ